MKTLNLMRIGALCALLTGGILPPTLQAAQQQEIPVLVTLANPAELPGVRISSDILGTYDQRVDRQLKAFIGLGGQLRFHTYDSPTRSVTVDLTGYVGVNGALPFAGAQFVHGNILTLGEDTDGNGVLTAKQLDPGSRGERLDILSIPVGGSRRAGLMLRFPIGQGKTAKTWQVRWGGGEQVGGATAGLVTVQRLSQTGWMIYATDTDLAAIGLANAAPSGVYSMPFSLLVEIAN